MTKQLRVGIIGFAHMHIIANAKVFARHPQVKITACADTIPDQPDVCEGDCQLNFRRSDLAFKIYNYLAPL